MPFHFSNRSNNSWTFALSFFLLSDSFILGVRFNIYLVELFGKCYITKIFFIGLVFHQTHCWILFCSMLVMFVKYYDDWRIRTLSSNKLFKILVSFVFILYQMHEFGSQKEKEAWIYEYDGWWHSINMNISCLINMEYII